MNGFFYVFVACLLLLLIAVFATNIILSNHRKRDDHHFLDDEGDHSYYDRHLIEKKDFHKANPDVKRNDIRSLRFLFYWFKLKK